MKCSFSLKCFNACHLWYLILITILGSRGLCVTLVLEGTLEFLVALDFLKVHIAFKVRTWSWNAASGICINIFIFYILTDWLCIPVFFWRWDPKLFSRFLYFLFFLNFKDKIVGRMYCLGLLFSFLLKDFETLFTQIRRKQNKNKNNPHRCSDLIDFTNINTSMSYAKQ